MHNELFSYINPTPQASRQPGLLAGKTFSIQANMSVRGWPAEAGSVALKGFIALEDATAIARLLQAGAGLIGSSRMSELGFGLAGDTTGKILSAGQSDMALMTDMMGEARVAAARNGLWAFKPSHGLVSRFGLIGLAPSLESFAVLACNPQDIASAMEAIAGDDDRDFSLHNGPLPSFALHGKPYNHVKNIGIVRQSLTKTDAAAARAFQRGMERLKSADFNIVEIDFPDYDLFPALHQCIGAVEASSSCGKYDGVRFGHRTATAKNWNEMYLKTRAECFGPLIKAYLFQGAYFQFENYAAFENAARIRARLVKTLSAVLADVDVLALPTRHGKTQEAPAKNINELYNDFLLTVAANVTGAPALQAPGYCIDGDTDCGLQLLALHLHDDSLVSVALRLAHIEKNGA